MKLKGSRPSLDTVRFMNTWYLLCGGADARYISKAVVLWDTFGSLIATPRRGMVVKIHRRNLSRLDNL